MTRKQQREKDKAKSDAAFAEAERIVATGKCPLCGSPLRYNAAILGWWQCSQYGAEGFRADNSKPACDFQTFTRH